MCIRDRPYCPYYDGTFTSPEVDEHGTVTESKVYNPFSAGRGPKFDADNGNKASKTTLDKETGRGGRAGVAQSATLEEPL